MAGSISVFPVPWFRERRWTGGANNHDVQSHGRAAQMALKRSLREDHGLLPRAAGTRSAATGNLCRLPQAQIPGWGIGGTDVHHSGCRGDDSLELALREIRETSSSK